MWNTGKFDCCFEASRCQVCLSFIICLIYRDLTCISNNAGVDNFGLGILLQSKQVCWCILIMLLILR